MTIFIAMDDLRSVTVRAWDLEIGDWIQVMPGDPWLRVRFKGREMNDRGERPVFFDGTKFILWADSTRVVEVRERGEAA